MSVNYTFRFSIFRILLELFYGARSPTLHSIPHIEDQTPVFMSRSDGVVQLYPQAPDPIFFAFYAPQGNCGGIWTHNITRIL